MALKRTIDENKDYYVKVDDITISTGDVRIGMTFYIDDLTKERQTETTMNYYPSGGSGELPEQFSIENVSKVDNNHIKACYEWLKSNIDLFKDFEDC